VDVATVRAFQFIVDSVECSFEIEALGLRFDGSDFHLSSVFKQKLEGVVHRPLFVSVSNLHGAVGFVMVLNLLYIFPRDVYMFGNDVMRSFEGPPIGVDYALKVECLSGDNTEEKETKHLIKKYLFK
tara:strand:- start:111 stop:491 length:381 start_codon:yes stop_codon:yes gene_type:complete